MDNLELVSIDGGNICRLLEKIGTALAIGDAIDEFVDGWNSVDCTHE